MSTSGINSNMGLGNVQPHRHRQIDENNQSTNVLAAQQLLAAGQTRNTQGTSENSGTQSGAFEITSDVRNKLAALLGSLSTQFQTAQGSSGAQSAPAIMGPPPPPPPASETDETTTEAANDLVSLLKSVESGDMESAQRVTKCS